jgi:nitrite reductase/ring-hydroxylating ferredoxin subunit
MKPGSSSPRPKKEGFVFVARTEEFQPGAPRAVRIMGKPVGVILAADGTFSAREMGCKHQGADLTGMPITDNIVTCSRHGWQYDLTTGQCVNRDSPPLRAHDTAVEESNVFVSLFPAG